MLLKIKRHTDVADRHTISNHICFPVIRLFFKTSPKLLPQLFFFLQVVLTSALI